MTTSTNAVVFYHANCMDGFGAAWAFHKLKEPEYLDVAYRPMTYGDDPLKYELIGKDVYILDFSFSRETLTQIATLADSVLLIDHHKTAGETFRGWDDQPANLEINFDMSRSGAYLTWRYFDTEREGMYALLEYIDDRDRWQFALPESKYINAWIASVPKTFSDYSEAAELIESEGIERVAVIGKTLLNQHSQICDSIIRDLARPFSIKTSKGTYHAKCCNCTGHFASDVGNLLAKESGTFGATYYTDSKGEVRWSLRSVGDFDVAEIAKEYGRGGHKNAAGFSLANPTPGDFGVTI